jgi:hypothetical protein
MINVWQVLFALAAFFNFAVATAMLAAPDRVARHLGITGPGASYVVATVGVLVAAFGIGYAMIAYRPRHHRGIVGIGMVGKVGVAGLGVMQYAAGIIPAHYLVLALGDVTFAVLFGLFLWRAYQGWAH